MNHKLKIMGLALFATFAMSAVAAASASAVVQHHITSDSTSGVTHLTAKALSDQKFEVTAEDNSVVCNEIDLTTGTSTFEGEETTEVTVAPTYNKEERTCKTSAGTVARVTSNGCHYTFTGKTTTDKTGNQSAAAHLVCPSPTGIEIHATVFDLPCIDVPSGQTFHGITYTEDPETTKALIIHADVHEIKSETTGACGEGTHEGGTYTGTATVTGFSDEAHTTIVDLGLNTTEE